MAAGALLVVPGMVTACSDDTGGDGAQLEVMATTSILGDITTELVGIEGVEVETVMPPGADPHEFEPSSRQAEDLLEADLLVVNGAGFEEGLQDLIQRAGDAGVEVFSFADHVDLLPAGVAHDHGQEDDVSGRDEHGGDDPHLWTDPHRVDRAAGELAATVAGLEGVDAGAIERRAARYRDELATLDADIREALAPIPDGDRILVTNHQVLGHFADRYGFTVVGAVIPSMTTMAEPSAAELDELAEEIETHQVPAIFTETTQAGDLADSLADSVGDVEVVALHSESLGDEGSGAETYVGMMRTNADRIAEALT